ncbi:uncharacterized protein B0H64DRAFT_102467 [Chaetomium fimeti]|uniref:Uncharacterized protein n=1 Tax=Chaetomium fimeti TaxID=1854472 RepID=A0AAE0HNR7_9PEZI|nr:hypothetical protein B0H64DRAFT_102467 [Chaetomium fimeti]
MSSRNAKACALQQQTTTGIVTPTMAPLDSLRWPVTTEVSGNGNGKRSTDVLPATYHYYETDGKRAVGDPAEDTPAFLRSELSLGALTSLLKHLWFAGAARPAAPLHSHVAMGREIVVSDRMDMHLLWSNEGRLFVKPVPRFLLNVDFCRSNLQCPDGCPCRDSLADACRRIPRKVALGFLYTYACLISSESDFHIANDRRLLPRMEDDKPIEWPSWKTLARELLRVHRRDPDVIHPRFLRAELRLSRINTISRFTSFPHFNPYVRGHYTYGSLFRDNLAWIATTTVFVAVVLTAMQVGLATERLQGDATFQQASYGFTVFAILGPVGAFALVILYALFHLVKDLPLLLGARRETNRGRPHSIKRHTRLATPCLRSPYAVTDGERRTLHVITRKPRCFVNYFIQHLTSPYGFGSRSTTSAKQHSFQTVPLKRQRLPPPPQNAPLTPTLKPQRRIKSIRGRGVLGSQRLHLGLGVLAHGLGGVVGAAHVGELVADAVGDDVGVERLRLALGDEGVRGEEGALVGRAPGAAELEVHARVALPKVGGARRVGLPEADYAR